MSSDPVRLKALEILLAVGEGNRLDPLLDGALRENHDPRSAGFLAELVRGTLQWQGRYDHVIASFSRKRPPQDPVLVNILRMTLHQLLGLDGVPAYAAIHQAGELCARKAGRRKVGFVNGMLQSIRRRLLVPANTQDGDAAVWRQANLRELFAALEQDRPRWLAAWYSLPPWLVARWIQHFGPEAENLCSWINQPVRLHLHVLGDFPRDEAIKALAAREVPAVPGDGPGTLTLTERVGRGRLAGCLAEMPWLVVQDIAVQQATRWLAAAAPTTGRWLDLCAAPGGKTAHLQALLPPEASLFAMDRKRERVRLLRETMVRVAGAAVPLVLADAEHPPFAPASFDCILLDGPCSGTGVLRHHPEGRWRLRPKTPANKARGLLTLAGEAADLLAPGGVLLYATCSLEPEENEGVLKSLLAARGDLQPCPDAAGNWQRLWLPQTAGGDGFFAARLGKSLGANQNQTGLDQ